MTILLNIPGFLLQTTHLKFSNLQHEHCLQKKWLTFCNIVQTMQSHEYSESWTASSAEQNNGQTQTTVIEICTAIEWSHGQHSTNLARSGNNMTKMAQQRMLQTEPDTNEWCANSIWCTQCCYIPATFQTKSNKCWLQPIQTQRR